MYKNSQPLHERDEMLEICKGNVEEFSMMIQLVVSIIEREKE